MSFRFCFTWQKNDRKIPKFFFCVVKHYLEVPQKILSVFFVQLVSSENLVPLDSCNSRQVRLIELWAIFLWLKKAQSDGFLIFCPKKELALLSMGLKKAFGKREASFWLCDLFSYTKVKKNVNFLLVQMFKNCLCDLFLWSGKSCWLLKISFRILLYEKV